MRVPGCARALACERRRPSRRRSGCQGAFVLSKMPLVNGVTHYFFTFLDPERRSRRGTAKNKRMDTQSGGDYGKASG